MKTRTLVLSLSASSQSRPAFRRRPGLPHLAGAGGLAILVSLSILAAWPSGLAPYDPTLTVGRPLQKPNPEFRLGTNDIGQDLLSELIWGTRISLGTGLIVATLAVVIGTAVGLAAGYTNNLFSGILMRLADLTLVLPFLPLVILLSAYLGQSQRNVILILTLVSWAGPARLIRAQVLSLVNERFVEAARAMGADRVRILIDHILPGVASIAGLQFVLVAASSILAEASLSFLGLGNPTAKSWGVMLYFARASGAFLGESWRWWVLPAGVMITLSVLSLVLIGFALEQRFEPGARGRWNLLRRGS